MDSSEQGRAAIGGTIPALVTLFDAAGEVDLDAMERHAGWLRARGVRALSPLGTTGEGPSLSVAERLAVIERLAPQWPLVAGTGCTSLPETIALSRGALAAGATALLVAPPSYYPGDERGVTEYYLGLFEALGDDARVVLYHIPARTGVPITSTLLLTLADRYGPALLGVKDSSGDFEHTKEWLRELPNLLVLNGSDLTASEHYTAGGRGTLTMLANVFPDRLERIRAGAQGGGDDDQTFISAVREVVASVPEIAGVKHLLHRVSGLPRSRVRPPLRDLDPSEERLLESWLETRGLPEPG